MDLSELIEKYNVQVPRYTSFPTVPQWKNEMRQGDWSQHIRHAIQANKLKEGISLYIHLPFCESLCTYCGCNKRITKNHGVEPEYINAILEEWALYENLLGKEIVIRELHLGGGTPTFFSPENLSFLLNGIFSKASLHPDFEGSFEGHPNNTSENHLQALYDLGFRRVSFGVQDLDLKVQKAINRIQPHEHLINITRRARSIGYTSVNYDLIYGLPHQTQSSVIKTFEAVLSLRPDRIAFYSYAHVPWTSKSQRAYDENDLPKGSDKLRLYQTGARMLLNAGYEDVGMDHFALPTDSLIQAKNTGKLHRNFMGYTTAGSDMLIGLGVSAISDVYFAYGQNVKTVEEYYDKLSDGEFPVFRGTSLKEEELIRRKHILDITCKYATEVNLSERILSHPLAKEYLQQLIDDGLLTKSGNQMLVTTTGQSFIRNIAALFDPYYLEQRERDEQRYSRAV